jgi:hypothetical protein
MVLEHKSSDFKKGSTVAARRSRRKSTMANLRIFFLALLCCACAEDEPLIISKTELLAGTSDFGKTWSISQIDVELGTLIPNPCVKDNFITYYPDGRYEINEGRSKCAPTDPPSASGIWNLNQSESILTVSIGDSTQLWQLEFVDRNHQVISSAFLEGSRTYTLSWSN